MAGHRVFGKGDYMMDNRHKTSQSGQILTRQHFLLLVYKWTKPDFALTYCTYTYNVQCILIK